MEREAPGEGEERRDEEEVRSGMEREEGRWEEYDYTHLQVYRREELEQIASLCKEFDVLCISDEVYEWLVYDGLEHIRMGRDWGGGKRGLALRVIVCLVPSHTSWNVGADVDYWKCRENI